MRHPLIPRGKGRRIGRKHPSSFSLGSGRASYVSSQRGPGRSPGRKLFYCNLISADRFCWQQILHLSSWKVGVLYHSVQKVGVPLPLCLLLFTLAFDLWPWNLCALSHVGWATLLPILVFLGRFVRDLSANTCQTRHVTLWPWPLTLNVTELVADKGLRAPSVYQVWSS